MSEQDGLGLYSVCQGFFPSEHFEGRCSFLMGFEGELTAYGIGPRVMGLTQKSEIKLIVVTLSYFHPKLSTLLKQGLSQQERKVLSPILLFEVNLRASQKKC